jgi:hypothetical protein
MGISKLRHPSPVFFHILVSFRAKEKSKLQSKA